MTILDIQKRAKAWCKKIYKLDKSTFSKHPWYGASRAPPMATNGIQGNLGSSECDGRRERVFAPKFPRGNGYWGMQRQKHNRRYRQSSAPFPSASLRTDNIGVCRTAGNLMDVISALCDFDILPTRLYCELCVSVYRIPSMCRPIEQRVSVSIVGGRDSALTFYNFLVKRTRCCYYRVSRKKSIFMLSCLLTICF